MSKITTIRDDVKGQRENFTYDPLDRLVSAVPSPMTGVTTTLDYTETYSYTPIGNFISKNGVTQYYTSTKPHAVTSLSNGASFTYDANGNMTQRIEGGVVYTQVWNVDNRLVQVDCTTQPTWFYYGPDGDMVRKDNPRDTTLYVSADSEVFHGTPTSTNITLYYTFNGTRVAIRRDADVYWLHGDHLGSASVATSITGTVVSEVRYLPFGETRWFTGTAPTNRLYTGQRSLMGIGLYDYSARMYSPSLGRFISADSIVPRAGDAQAFNRYAYARNSPLSRVDPSGHTDCAATDNACWQNQWISKNRWYEAHGYFWRGNGWEYEYLGQQPKFNDVLIFSEVLGEAGIVWDRGSKNWGWDELVNVTTAVVKLAHQIDKNSPIGMIRLKNLLGNSATYFLRSSYSTEHSVGTPAQTDFTSIWFFDAAFAVSRTLIEIYGTVVHELAHVMDGRSRSQSGATMSAALPWNDAGLGLYPQGVKENHKGSGEYFAEALKMWVLPLYPGYGSLTQPQIDWLNVMMAR